MISENEDYKVEDMPIAATFVSPVKRLKVCIEHAEHFTAADGSMQKVPGVGYWAEFEGGKLPVKNSKVLDKLLKHQDFNTGNSGFFIDETDYTGFWRSQEIVETKQITVAVAQAEGSYHIDPSKIDLSKLATIDPGKVEPLHTTQRV